VTIHVLFEKAPFFWDTAPCVVVGLTAQVLDEPRGFSFTRRRVEELELNFGRLVDPVLLQRRPRWDSNPRPPA
jgi:hypothetical protein